MPPAAAQRGLDWLPFIKLLGIQGMEHACNIALDAPLQARFILLAAQPPVCSKAGQKLGPLLTDWQENWPLRAVLGAHAAQVTLPGLRLRQPQELDRLIRLGQGLLTYRAAVMVPADDA